MRKFVLLILLILILLPLLGIVNNQKQKKEEIKSVPSSHWFMLYRNTGEEFLYIGKSGDVKNSKLVRKFQVKTGETGKSPTPLPKLMGKKYWLVIKKESSADNPDTAPYFLTLNIPNNDEWPYGPTPYEECLDSEGLKTQCDWQAPGSFGLHGVGGNEEKLEKINPGSNGCIRHSDEDITYLFNLLSPNKEEIRYYIQDI